MVNQLKRALISFVSESDREQFTLKLLEDFKKRLQTVKEKEAAEEEEEERKREALKEAEQREADLDRDDSWYCYGY